MKLISTWNLSTLNSRLHHEHFGHPLSALLANEIVLQVQLLNVAELDGLEELKRLSFDSITLLIQLMTRRIQRLCFGEIELNYRVV